eukprot:snap_masked-scaffold_21-processed-gene-1.4-mRNA-1 protein AED:0.07 eAED:0.12 QI:0/0/0/1/1/1/2/0/435
MTKILRMNNEGFPRISKNIYIILTLNFFWGLADSIWTNSILSTWLFLLASQATSSSASSSSNTTQTNANTIVGSIEASQGIAGFLTTIPLGFLADSYGKGFICNIGGAGFSIAAGLTLFAIFLHESSENHNLQLVIFTISLILWGIFCGIFLGPIEALFADSVPNGQRSKYFTYLQISYSIPALIGPLITIHLFQSYGDEWSFSHLKIPFILGLLLEFPAGFCALLLRDKYCTINILNETVEKEPIEKNIYLEKNIFGYTITEDSICFIILWSNLFYAFGSGMTVNFFPLFFKNTLSLSPSSVQITSMLSRLTFILLTMFSQKLSLYISRVRIVFFTHGSILMDNVPSEKRSRWKSFHSITSYGWTGTAFFGGVLADKYSYGYSFYVTAIFQLIGTLIYSLLFNIVQEESILLNYKTLNTEEENSIEKENEHLLT